MSNLIISKKMA